MALILLAQIVCSAPVLRWSKRFGGDIDSSPVLSDDRKTLYLGSYDHILYALDTATGNVRWKYSIYTRVTSIIAIKTCHEGSRRGHHG